ncbi:unnamed protein product [Staurois parvus]|uniref:G-protein coupled receptors family 1 profile domain-containing protein n=1 Tax=Staurois parvus TaxID=386267 RepID=A0ABN9AMX2_9NEOB|nr:unnamed protein product [Staurois parvus]
MKKTVNSVWFLSLALADFIFCFFLPLLMAYIVLGRQWPFGTVICKLCLLSAYLNMSASVLQLTIISIDRCISVVFPVWCQNHRTVRLAVKVVLAIWIVSLLLNVSYLINTHADDSDDNFVACYKEWAMERAQFMGWYYDEEEEKEKIKIRKAMFIMRSISMFAVPFTIILISCTLIFFKMRKFRKPKRSRRSFRLIIAVVVCFFICWFPYNIWPFITISGQYWNLDRLITEISVCLAYFSSCINPIIYVFFCHDFKKNFIKSLPARSTKLSMKILT